MLKRCLVLVMVTWSALAAAQSWSSGTSMASPRPVFTSSALRPHRSSQLDPSHRQWFDHLMTKFLETDEPLSDDTAR